MSMFGDSLGFMMKLGVYDVVLPFLLVFVLVFAFLEKTAILGTENERTKKNLNSMVAFVMGFMVVASSQIVAIINKTLSQVFLLLLLIMCVLMVAGSFHEQKKTGFFLEGKYNIVFMVVVIFSIFMIFLNALGWLEWVYNFLKNNWNASYVAAILLMLFIIGFMWFITSDGSKSKSDEDKK